MLGCHNEFVVQTCPLCRESLKKKFGNRSLNRVQMGSNDEPPELPNASRGYNAVIDHRFVLLELRS